MNGKYILDAGGNAVQEPDLLKWGRWFQTADRHVANDIIGGVRVSTVFIGLDHIFDDGPPLIFETMVFGGPLDQEMERYSTREQAAAGHAVMIARVRASAA